jgi:hypothetical protein
MVKYTYIVVKQLFYKGESGFDTAMPTSASDIVTFSNWDKAVEFVEEQMAYYLSAENHYEDKFELYDYNKDECKYQGVEKMRIYAQENYNYNNIRHCFRITKQKNLNFLS